MESSDLEFEWIALQRILILLKSLFIVPKNPSEHQSLKPLSIHSDIPCGCCAGDLAIVGGASFPRQLRVVNIGSGHADDSVKDDAIPGLERDFECGGAVSMPDHRILFCGGCGGYSTCYYLDPLLLTVWILHFVCCCFGRGASFRESEMGHERKGDGSARTQNIVQVVTAPPMPLGLQYLAMASHGADAYALGGSNNGWCAGASNRVFRLRGGQWTECAQMKDHVTDILLSAEGLAPEKSRGHDFIGDPTGGNRIQRSSLRGWRGRLGRHCEHLGQVDATRSRLLWGLDRTRRYCGSQLCGSGSANHSATLPLTARRRILLNKRFVLSRLILPSYQPM